MLYVCSASSFYLDWLKYVAIRWTLVLCMCLYLEWYMARLAYKNEHQKDTCYNEIGLCAQNKDITPGSIPNIIWGGGGLCDHLLRKKNIQLDLL